VVRTPEGFLLKGISLPLGYLNLTVRKIMFDFENDTPDEQEMSEAFYFWTLNDLEELISIMGIDRFKGMFISTHPELFKTLFGE
jgi:hypothetical protein